MQKSVVNFRGPKRRSKTGGVWVKVDPEATHGNERRGKKPSSVWELCKHVCGSQHLVLGCLRACLIWKSRMKGSPGGYISSLKTQFHSHGSQV